MPSLSVVRLHLAIAALLFLACDLPPAFNEVDPDEVEPREVDTADVTTPPAGDNLWTTSFVGWSLGGQLACGGPGGGVGGAPGGGFGGAFGSGSVVVEIWEGVDDPCAGDRLVEGARLIQIQFSDSSAGNFDVANACVGPRTAVVLFAVVRGGALQAEVATQGTAALLGIDSDDVLEGTFSVQFPSTTGFTSGSFSASLRCLFEGVSQ